MIAKWVRKHCAGLLVQFQGNLAGDSFRLHSTLLSALGQRKHTPKPGRKLFTRTTKDFPQSQAQTTKPVLTRWERMGRQTHPSYQCETYAFFFLLGSEFLGRTERSELSSSQLVKKPGGEVRRGGRRLTAACRSAPGFVPQNLPRKRAHSPLGKGTFGVCPDCWAIYIENRRKLLHSFRRENGEKTKKRGLLPGMNQAKGPAKKGNPIKSVQGYPIRSMENRFANPPVKSPQTRMKPKKSGLDI